MKAKNTYMLFVFLGAALFSIHCTRYPKAQMSPQKARAFIWTNKKADSVVWRLSYSFDPYNGGKYTYMDSSKTRYLILEKDGTCTQLDNYNFQKGTWMIKKDSSALALIWGKDEAKSNLKSELLFRHQIKRIDQDTLVLAWQGRHGFVEEVYTRGHLIYPHQE